MHIDLAALDAVADSLTGTNKALVMTAGTLSVAADPSGAVTTEDSPLEPNPMNKRHKAEAHALTLVSRGIRVTSVRLAPYVYGRGGSGVKLFMELAARTGGVTCVDGGKNYTTVVHVDDAARLYLLAAQKGKAGEVFNASGATDVTAGQIFNGIAAIIGLPLRNITADDAEAKLGKFVAFFLKAENRASGAKAVRELGWQPNGIPILDDISKGSYVPVAKLLNRASG
jgi:nucleoside-diphosphate-sugar epimerase